VKRNLEIRLNLEFERDDDEIRLWFEPEDSRDALACKVARECNDIEWPDSFYEFLEGHMEVIEKD